MAATLHLPGVVLTRRRETVLTGENGTVNYNASSPRTIMPSQCAFLVTMGVALMGVRLQRGPAKTTFAARFSRVRVNTATAISRSRSDGSFRTRNISLLATSRLRNAKRPSSATLSKARRSVYSLKNSYIDRRTQSITRRRNSE